MSYLGYLCLFTHSGVQHTLYCVFVFLRLVYPMFPVSLDWPFFFIAPSIFSNVYLHYGPIILWPFHSLQQFTL